MQLHQIQTRLSLILDAKENFLMYFVYSCFLDREAAYFIIGCFLRNLLVALIRLHCYKQIVICILHLLQ